MRNLHTYIKASCIPSEDFDFAQQDRLAGYIVVDVESLHPEFSPMHGGGAHALSADEIAPQGNAIEVDLHICAEGRSQDTQAYALQQAEAVLGLFRTLTGLGGWDKMSGLQRTSAIVAIYNQINILTDSGLGGGSAGTLEAGLSFMGALESNS